MSAETSTMTRTDSTAMGAPKAASFLALLWEEEGGFAEMMGSEGGIEFESINVAEELTVTDGTELDGFSAGSSAKFVVLAENVSIPIGRGHISNAPEIK